MVTSIAEALGGSIGGHNVGVVVEGARYTIVVVVGAAMARVVVVGAVVVVVVVATVVVVVGAVVVVVEVATVVVVVGAVVVVVEATVVVVVEATVVEVVDGSDVGAAGPPAHAPTTSAITHHAAVRPITSPSRPADRRLDRRRNHTVPSSDRRNRQRDTGTEVSQSNPESARLSPPGVPVRPRSGRPHPRTCRSYGRARPSPALAAIRRISPAQISGTRSHGW